MDTEQLKSLMLEALRPETPGGVRDPESDADKAAWWLRQAMEAMTEARKSALAYGCKCTAAMIDVTLKHFEGREDGKSIFAMLALEAACEYKDRHL